ncbi:MAG: HAD hydrolase family protein [Anaerolineae bacterium]|nr:HAD hydrolase family protein [Anaerolineae bacterium]
MSEQRTHILIVEDSLGVSRALHRALSLHQNGRYRVETCDSGETALERLHEQTFHLLISDFRLPGINGLELLERAQQINPDVRSILITAFGSPEVEARAREQATAYLPKPFSLKEIIRLVEDVISTPPISQPPPPRRSTTRRVTKEMTLQARKSAHLLIIASDLDGTLTETGTIAPETWQILKRAKTSGFVLILVTGRTLDTFVAMGPFSELCEAIVAENGAVVYFPRRDVVILPFGRLDTQALQRLELMSVPLERGMAIAATILPYDEAILRALRDSRSAANIEYNRNAVMALPPGATKGTGLLYALRELGYSPRNVVACGDAENDRSLFEAVELAVAVSNAQPTLKAAADIVLDEPSGAGVGSLLEALLDGNIPDRQPRSDRRLLLGHRLSGAPVYLDPFAVIEHNIGIFGASASGKSWLTGLIAEELLKQDYQVCIIDPEGDYRGLGTSPRILLLGGAETPLPGVADVINFSEWNATSLILDLSMYTIEERNTYLAEFMRALRGLRSRRGRPHCFIVDEFQSFCPPEGGELANLFLEAMHWGGFCAVSYRPSQITPVLLAALDHWLITPLRLPEEIETLAPRLRQYENGEAMLAQLPTLPKGQAYLCPGMHKPWMSGIDDIFKFRVGPRTIPHIRHLHKYLHAPLPQEKRFYFHNQGGYYLGRAAANLWEFREALNQVPVGALKYHLERGDFEYWLEGALHDEELARRIHKLHSRDLESEALRQALLEIVIDRYEELETLA